MSSSGSSNPTPEEVEAFLDQFNFTGGNPSSKDLAPSIVFSIIVSGAGTVSGREHD